LYISKGEREAMITEGYVLVCTLDGITIRHMIASAKIKDDLIPLRDFLNSKNLRSPTNRACKYEIELLHMKKDEEDVINSISEFKKHSLNLG